jgi:2-methylcitrate dehydratase PrpD
MKNLTDEQIREIAKSKKLINKNKNEIHNIEINEDLTKNYNNNKHSLNSLDDSLNLTKKTKLEENKIESDNVSNFSINTDELEENLNDQTEFKIKYSILNSSNFLEDLTKYFLSFKKKVETKSGINLDDKLQEYYN